MHTNIYQCTFSHPLIQCLKPPKTKSSDPRNALRPIVAELARKGPTILEVGKIMKDHFIRFIIVSLYIIIGYYRVYMIYNDTLMNGILEWYIMILYYIYTVYFNTSPTWMIWMKGYFGMVTPTNSKYHCSDARAEVIFIHPEDSPERAPPSSLADWL